ncbi:tape-measure protein [Streptomyces sp. SP18CS02]|uniref:tape-measure protein n=1 Tax=Streptomyces sp. SP18CS02 TaxID=3002531 RepID=UPI002E7A959D|nr:tape-measure protein [Streptomyces sp. SP18CS02]MEE1751736.1 tape-measure protein [Streptomyces sp. SP18CS02]
MSAAALPAMDPMAGVAAALRGLRGHLSGTTGSLRTIGRGIRAAAGTLDGIRPGTQASATAVGGLKAGAEASGRSAVATGRTAGTAGSRLRSPNGRVRSAGGALGALAAEAGGFVSVADLLGAAGITVGGFMAVFGGALAVAAGAMTAVNIAMRANPLGFVLGLLVPVIGYLIELAVESQTGQRIMRQVFTQVLKGFQGIGKFLAPVVRAYATVVSAYFTAVLTIVTGVLKVIGALLDKGFPAVRQKVEGVTRALSGIVRSTWDSLQNGVRPVLDWITQKIPDAFTRVTNATGDALGGIGDFILTGLQAVVGVMKAPLEGLISFANWVIDGLNSLSFSILGKKFGVDIPKIPMLAEGGVVTPPHGSRPGSVLPLAALEQLRPAEPGSRADTSGPRRVGLHTFHEPAGGSAYGIAEDLLFLARAS